MRRIAFACLCLMLSGCGYNTWWNPPFTSGNNPNMPAGDSENMRRVTGEQVEVQPLTAGTGRHLAGSAATGTDAAGAGAAGRRSQQTETAGAGIAAVPAANRRKPQAALSAAAATLAWQFDAAWSNQPGLDASTGAKAAARPPTPTPPAQNPAGQVYQTQKRAGRDQRRQQRLPDAHHAGRWFGDRGAQWQWDQHDHTFGWHDRDGANPTLS